MRPATALANLKGPAEFEDGLGVRRLVSGSSGGDQLALLRVRDELAQAPLFEPALRERAGRLANFRHAYYAQVRRVEHTEDGGLGVVFEHVAGARLSHILQVAEARRLDLDINAALCLLRQLVPAVGMLHQNARDVADGALAPERIVVTPHARVVVTDYVFGSAIEQLQYGRERLWRDLRVLVPPGAGPVRINHRADVMQLGAIALALVMGRPLRDEDFRKLAELLDAATEMSALGGREPLSGALRRWLARALQLEPRSAFESALEAQLALDGLLSDESGYIAAPIALETFLARYAEDATLPMPAAAPSAPLPGPTPHDSARSGDVVRFPSQPVPPPLPPAVVAQAAMPSLVPAAPVSTGPEQAVEPDAPAAAVVTTMDHAAARAAARWRLVAAALLAVTVIEGGLLWWSRDAVLPSADGTLKLETRPSGATVSVDGSPRGTTPMTLTLASGPHVVELGTTGAEPRVLPLVVEAGVTHTHYVELAAPVASVPAPAASPAAPAPAAGTVPPIVLAAGMVPSAPPAPAGGWVNVQAPYEMQIFAGGRQVGVTTTRVPLPEGRHEIEIVSQTLAFRTTKTVEIEAGKVTNAKVALPNGVIHLNASPWAEVWIDGQKVGDTPIGNHQIPIGPHEIVFKHPELGEERHAATVTLAEPLRLSVDLNRGP